MAYPRDICPGVGLPPKGPIRDVGKPRPHGKCPCCRREYALKVGPRGDGWKLRHHKGLPVANDGGCPYRCPPDCDFDCYVPGARNERPGGDMPAANTDQKEVKSGRFAVDSAPNHHV